MIFFCLFAYSLSPISTNEIDIDNKDFQAISDKISNELAILDLAYSRLIINIKDKPNTIKCSEFDIFNSMNIELEKVIAVLEGAINIEEDTIKILSIIEIFQIVVFKYINFIVKKGENESFYQNNRFFIQIGYYIYIHFINFSLATLKQKEITVLQQMIFEATNNLQSSLDTQKSSQDIVKGIQIFFNTIKNYLRNLKN
ncbi:hypothetical protein GVAV_000114 [Gurleya vavrai]